MLLPGERVLNARLSSVGRPVVKIEVLPVSAGSTVRLRFLEVGSPWRQGVWLGTDGELAVGGGRSSQFVLWADSAPEETAVQVLATDGRLCFYNVWDSGRGLGPFESQSATSGMLVDGGRYSCSDIAADPAFDRLVFSVGIDEV